MALTVLLTLCAVGRGQSALTRLGEFRVSVGDATAIQQCSVDSDGQGNFVTVWSAKRSDGSGWDVYCRRYSTACSPRSAPGVPLGEFRVNTVLGGDQEVPSVAMNKRDGSFIVTWQGNQPAGGSLVASDGYDIYFRRFGADGAPLDAEERVANFQENLRDELHPAVAIDSSAVGQGRFVIVWRNVGGRSVGHRFTGAGTPIGSDLVITVGEGDPDYTSVAFDGVGRFIVAYQANRTSQTSPFDIRARRFNFASGEAETPDTAFTINTGLGSSQFPQVDAREDGRFAITWMSNDNGTYDIRARVFSAAGFDSPSSPETVLNAGTSGSQQFSSLRFLPDGRLVAAWASDLGSNSDVVARLFDANLTPVTDDLPVNQSLAGNQFGSTLPFVAVDPQGNFVVAFADDLSHSIRAEKFYLPNQGPPLSEFRVNTTTLGDQSLPAVACDTAGNFVIIWVSDDGSGTGIFGQRFSSRGARLGSEFRVNSLVSGVQSHPWIAMAPDGRFVVLWDDAGRDGSGGGIYAQRFDAQGVAQDPELRINNEVKNDQYQPVAAMDSQGNFTVAWTSVAQAGDGDQGGVFRRRFDSLGTALDALDQRVNNNIGGDQVAFSLAGNAAGKTVVAWDSTSNQTDFDVYARFYNEFGSPPKVSFLASPSDVRFEYNQPSVAMAENGGFVVVWRSNHAQDGNGAGCFGQLFDAAGNSVREFSINSYFAANQEQPSVAMDAQGNFVVAWQSFGQDESDFGVYAQRFNNDGTKKGGEFRVNQTTAGFQGFSLPGERVAMDSAGNFIVTWISAEQDGSGFGVYASKVFVPALPKVLSVNKASSAVNSVDLTSVVNPGAAPTQVRVEFGRTSALELTPSPWQSIGDGSDDVSVSIQITGLEPSTSYFYQIVAKNDQGPEVRSALLTFSTAPLRVVPATLPAGAASLQVNLTPSAARWRIVGETSWRQSGALGNAAGLAVASEYVIEFEPQGGPVPLPQKVRLAAGLNQATVTYPAGAAETGRVAVVIKPDEVATAVVLEQRGQWRFLGESDTQWRNSGAEEVRPAGTYVVEFKALNGRTKLPNRGISVQTGRTVTLTVFYEDPATVAGTLPQPLTVADATMQEPYFLAGQVQTDIGDGSGYVVKERVVLTAGHVVFDDQALSAVTGTIDDAQLSSYAAPGIRWRFQRMRGQVEPVPIEPRGSYVLSGYAAARRGVQPGQGTQQSQENDVAALYFNVPAGRGGSSGYLVSGTNTDWVLRNSLKTFVSYPQDQDFVSPGDSGKMHATTPSLLSFTKPYGPASAVYRTTAIAGVGGSSGGALCVQYYDGHYFPAAVYVGGNGEAIFRAIDAQVDDLIQRADVSSRGGDNNTSGGIVQVSSRRSVASFTVAELKVNLGPAGVIAAGAKWQVAANGTPRTAKNSGETELVAGGSYTVTFAKVNGFATPPPKLVEIDNTDQIVITGTYASITSTALPAGIAGTAYAGQVAATGNPSGYSAPALTALGLSIDAQGRISGNLSVDAVGVYPITIEALYAGNEKATAKLTLLVRKPAVYFVAYDASRGTVTGKPAVKAGPNTVAQKQQVVLTAKPKLPDFLFNQWKVTGDTPTTANGPTLSFAIDTAQALTVEAEFIENPFKKLVGTFTGRVAAAVPSFESSGTLTLKLTNSGAFTGSLLLGLKTHPVRGAFSVDGSAQVDLSGSGLVLSLNLDLTKDSERVTGNLSGGGLALSLALDRAAFTKSTPATTYRGDFTLIMLRNAPQSSEPQGHGFGVVNVSDTGLVRFAGVLGDGAGVSQSAVISKAGVWQFHAPLYGRRGVMTGDLQFRDLETDGGTQGVSRSSLDGKLNWMRPTLGVKQPAYPSGFTATVSTYGARFIKNTLPFDYDGAVVQVGEGNLGSVPDATIVINRQQSKSVPQSRSDLTLKVTPSTRLLKGNFVDPQGVSRSFRGVLYPANQKGFGQFLGAPLPPPANWTPTGYVEFCAN